jgi:hypothetical protein
MSENPTPEILADYALGITDRAIQAARRKLRPSPLDLVFDRALSGCVHTGPVYNAATGARLQSEWLRVGVSNNSGRELDGVRVQALSLKPDKLGTLPVRLHRMHDNPPAGGAFEASTVVPATKTPVVFMDVVSHIAGAPYFQLLHLMPDVEPWFAVGAYELTLVVTAEGGVKSKERTFSLALLEDRIEFVRLH